MPRLTQRLIDSLQTGERDAIVFDATLPGFGVRVFASGRKSYIVQYRIKKRTRRYTLGNCSVLTPADARKMAASLLTGVLQGKDPAEARVETRKAPTVDDLADRYLRDYAAKKKSWDGDRRGLKGKVRPVLGSVHIVRAGSVSSNLAPEACKRP